MNNLFDNIRIVLVEPSHSGNIGSSARAMLNMGITNLWIVNPKKNIDDKEIALACHAKELIENATVVSNLEKALKDIDYVVGTSARVRKVSLPVKPISIVVKNIITKIKKSNEKVAILFGRERIGLLNEELLMSNIHAYIPSNENYSSLNLAQAVQIVSYEIYKQLDETINFKKTLGSNFLNKKASVQELQGLYDHFKYNMIKSGFLDKNKSEHIMDKIRRIFQRVELENQELNILRGFLASLDK